MEGTEEEIRQELAERRAEMRDVYLLVVPITLTKDQTCDGGCVE